MSSKKTYEWFVNIETNKTPYRVVRITSQAEDEIQAKHKILTEYLYIMRHADVMFYVYHEGDEIFCVPKISHTESDTDVEKFDLTYDFIERFSRKVGVEVVSKKKVYEEPSSYMYPSPNQPQYPSLIPQQTYQQQQHYQQPLQSYQQQLPVNDSYRVVNSYNDSKCVYNNSSLPVIQQHNLPLKASKPVQQPYTNLQHTVPSLSNIDNSIYTYGTNYSNYHQQQMNVNAVEFIPSYSYMAQYGDYNQQTQTNHYYQNQKY